MHKINRLLFPEQQEGTPPPSAQKPPDGSTPEGIGAAEEALKKKALEQQLTKLAEAKPKLKPFKLVSMPTIKELETEVNKAIEEGYHPYGPITSHPPEEKDPQRWLRFTQSMLSKEALY